MVRCLLRFLVMLCGCAVLLPACVQAAGAPEDGTWRGTYACSAGAGAAAGLKPFSFPIEFTVAGGRAVITTNNADFAEQTSLLFDGKGRVSLELIGQRKADPSKNWLVRASGVATAERAEVEGPMYRKDETTLVRQKCLYTLQKQGGGGTVASATTAAKAPVTPNREAPAAAVVDAAAAAGTDAARRAAETETLRLRAEAAAAKQQADEAEKRASALAQQLAAVAAKPEVSAGSTPVAAAPAAQGVEAKPAAAVVAKVEAPVAPPAAPQATPAGGPVKAPAAPAEEDPAVLLYRGTHDETRLKQLFASLAARDSGKTAPKNDAEAEKFAEEDARTTLILLNSLDAHDLNVFLNKEHPGVVRDLAGNTTLGNGASNDIAPISILLVNGMIRVPRHTVLQSAALTLGLATEPERASFDTGVYLQTLSAMLGSILREKGISPAAPKAGGTPRFIFSFAPADWERAGEEGMARVARNYAIIIAFDAFVAPAEGTDIALYQRNGTPAANARLRAAYEQRVQALQTGLSQPAFVRLATPSATDMASLRLSVLRAGKAEQERLQAEMLTRIARIDAAVAQGTALAGALRIYRKGAGLSGAPQERFCTVSAADGLLLKGLAASPAFLAWSAIPAGSRFSQVLETPEAMYGAIVAGKCAIVIDSAANLKTYMGAIGRDGVFAYNVGPTADRAEAQEPFAIAAGYQGWEEFQFAEAVGGKSPAEIKTLKGFGISNEAGFKEAVGRMRASAYATDEADLEEFLADEVEGKKSGQSAKAYRAAENRRIAAEQKEREAAAAQRLKEEAKEFPYVAVLTCGMGERHINILACFAGQGSSSVDTELKLQNGDQLAMFKAYNLSKAGRERGDGFYIDLREHFSLVAQNSHGTLVLGLKVMDRVSGKVLYQNVGAKFDVLSVRN
jgi:hypothetical protein